MCVQAKEPDKQWDVTCSYCEVYNELIFDLLQDNSPPLDLRSAQIASLDDTISVMNECVTSQCSCSRFQHFVFMQKRASLSRHKVVLNAKLCAATKMPTDVRVVDVLQHQHIVFTITVGLDHLELLYVCGWPDRMEVVLKAQALLQVCMWADYFLLSVSWNLLFVSTHIVVCVHSHFV